METKEAARRTRQQLLSVLNHAQVTIFTVDRSQNVTMLEGALLWDAAGMDHEAGSRWYIGKNVHDVFGHLRPRLPQGDNAEFLSPIKAIIKGETLEAVREHGISKRSQIAANMRRSTDKCAGDRAYRTRFLPIFGKRNTDGRITESAVEGVIGVIMDVTELKAKEADIAVQAKEKRQLVENEAAAKEASRLKSQFLANVS